MQYIRVEVDEGRTYTYQWDDSEFSLRKGDDVLLPSNIVKDRPFTGRVIRLLPDGPDTTFPLKNVIGRVEEREPDLSAEDLDLL